MNQIQRAAQSWPVVHLEREAPEYDGVVVVDGAVRHPRRLDASSLVLGEHALDFHCVWGWSRPAVRWRGVLLAEVFDVVQPEGEWVVVQSASGVYSASLPVDDAGRGVLAWGRDGEALSGDAGGPVRYVAPPDYWAYKGVKWVAGITVVDRFQPGFWESKVADPIGKRL